MPRLYMVVGARLLFGQQSHVGRHQVYTPLQSQLFADKGGLQYRLGAVVGRGRMAAARRLGIEECAHDVSQIVRLPQRCVLKSSFLFRSGQEQYSKARSRKLDQSVSRQS